MTKQITRLWLINKMIDHVDDDLVDFNNCFAPDNEEFGGKTDSIISTINIALNDLSYDLEHLKLHLQSIKEEPENEITK